MLFRVGKGISHRIRRRGRSRGALAGLCAKTSRRLGAATMDALRSLVCAARAACVAGFLGACR